MLARQTHSHGQRAKKPHTQRQDFAYQYHEQTIPFSIWFAGPKRGINTMVFLGTVQIGKLPEWIAQECSPGTAVVQGAPHWFAKDDGSDLAEFMQRFTKEAFLSALKHPHTEKLRVIVDSQATPNALELLAQDAYITKVGAVVLVQPLGLNPATFAGTAEQRIGTFKKRIARNFRHQLGSLMSDRRLLYNHKQILRTVGYSNAKASAQYNVGLMTNSVGDLRKLRAAHVRMVIVSGERDALFPPREIQDNLRASELDIPVVSVPGVPHSPLATRQGLKLFHNALEHFGAH